MATQQDDKTKLPGGQEGTTGNDQGMVESQSEDMDAGNMQHGNIGGAGLPDNVDSSTGSSDESGHATGGDIGADGGTAGSLKGNSNVENN